VSQDRHTVDKKDAGRKKVGDLIKKKIVGISNHGTARKRAGKDWSLKDRKNSKREKVQLQNSRMSLDKIEAHPVRRGAFGQRRGKADHLLENRFSKKLDFWTADG